MLCCFVFQWAVALTLFFTFHTFNSERMPLTAQIIRIFASLPNALSFVGLLACGAWNLIKKRWRVAIWNLGFFFGIIALTQALIIILFSLYYEC